MKDYDRVLRIMELLDEQYPDNIRCYLDHETPWQLLIATILSAQCTDARVNIVTKDLFKKFPTIESYAYADVQVLEEAIRPTGFYRNKAKNIKECCRQLLENHGGVVPSDIEALTKLRGVGRKTANVVRGNIFKIESIVVDTHVKRISKKLGFTAHEDPVKIEFDLMEIIPKENWIRYNHQIIALGRTICKARSPKCEECFLLRECPWGKQKLMLEESGKS